jgi:phosphatidylinositol kinase/protein kinase (PI-3  family)
MFSYLRKGFLVVREKSISDSITTVVASYADSGLPCFMHKVTNISELRQRFVPNLTCYQAAKYFKKKVSSAAKKWTTNAYDYVQKVQNNIAV